MMTAYYLLGGPTSLRLDSHARMYLFHGRWSPKTKATVDANTAMIVIFYLAILLAGGISSTEYAITYGQKNDSSRARMLAGWLGEAMEKIAKQGCRST